MMFKETRRGPNNGFNNTGLRFGEHGTKKILLGVVDSKSLTGFELCATAPNSTQQHTQESANGPTCNTQTMLRVLGQKLSVRLHGVLIKGSYNFSGFVLGLRLRHITKPLVGKFAGSQESNLNCHFVT